MKAKKIIPFFCLLLISSLVEAQTTNSTIVIDTTEKMPEFPDGDLALFNWLKQNTQYPKDARKQRIEGKVYVTFVILEDGSITKAEVKKSVYPSLDQEAIRVISSLPKFNPAIQKGRPVRVSYMIPVIFKLP